MVAEPARQGEEDGAPTGAADATKTGKKAAEKRSGASHLTGVSSLALGILAGIGGFVDFGGVVTSTQAGAQFHFALLWTIVVGVVGFAVYAEISGRIAISTGRTMYDVIRDRLGARLALIPLITTTVSQVLTVFVELAGMTLAAEYATHVSYLLWLPLAALLLLGIIWRAGFELLDNSAALLGLAMIVTVAIMVKVTNNWGDTMLSLVHPGMSHASPVIPYFFAVVGLLGAYMTPYQFTFYSSGALEEEWTAEDLVTNRVVSIVGTAFGAIITIALMVGGAMVLFPLHNQASTFADAVIPANVTFGLAAVVFFVLGTFAVSMGAGLEATLSGSYAIMQYFGWDWGKKGRPHTAPLFHLACIVIVVIAFVIGETRVDPIQMTTITMVISAIALPFNFLPLLIVANDKDYMGEQKNTWATNIVAGIVLAILVAVTIAAIPLFILDKIGVA